MYPGPRATPTWHEGRLFFAGPDGQVGCLNAADGRRVWQMNVNERFGGRGTGFGYSCSPLIEDGKVLLPVGGEGASVVALDAEDGSTVWASGDEPASYCSALPLDFHGRRCVVAFLQNALALFDLETGRQLGLQSYSSGYDEHAAEPLYDEPYLMAASPFRAGAVCYRLEGVNTAGGEGMAASIDLVPVWSNRRFSNDTASSVLVDGRVYGFDLRDAQAKAQRPSRGTYKCLDFSTGDVLWETDQVGHATVVAADGKLFLFTDAGELILARANPERFEELGRTQVFQGEICWTAPALDRGRLYLRSPTHLACVYVGRPEGLDGVLRQAARPASSKPASSTFDLAWFVGGEREFAFDPADRDELCRWYMFCVLGVLMPAVAVAGMLRAAVAARWPGAARHALRVTFWTIALVFGIVGTPVFNRWAGPFVFTWPVCLFVAHQVALNTIVSVNRSPRSRRGRWWSLAAAAFFLAVCLGYYLACRRLSLATEWAFLLGFLPSWPIAVPTAYRWASERRTVLDLVCVWLSFTLFFWSAGLVLLWQAARV
jgi:outer membrane protein assembly factor BamB